jgi:hypothetical protein
MYAPAVKKPKPKVSVALPALIWNDFNWPENER